MELINNVIPSYDICKISKYCKIENDTSHNEIEIKFYDYKDLICYMIRFYYDGYNSNYGGKREKYNYAILRANYNNKNIDDKVYDCTNMQGKAVVTYFRNTMKDCPNIKLLDYL